jgi:hypothetical protein
MKFLVLILFATLIGCSVGEKQVKFEEMAAGPQLRLDGNDLLITTSNSRENSALLIYDVESVVDNENKVILLKGFQAAGKEFETEFRVILEGVDSISLNSYSFFWLDPDNKRTELIPQSQ